jgi:hypothetical protein
MEGLVRLVTESLERHGFVVPPAPIEWSPWQILEPNLCLSAPCHPGLFVVAEKMVPHTVAATRALQLVILKINKTQDLGVEMARLCCHSPLHERITSGRCFVRFAVVADDVHRDASCAALQQWFTHTLETSTDSHFPVDLVVQPAAPNRQNIPAERVNAEPVLAGAAQPPTHATPAPLPSGF